ncbi:MAG: hypothetical protein Q8P23_00165 [bacterium]|nr:hypothetical protein [bacterium]
MTTVINTPSNTDSGDGGAGWAVAVIILLVVIGIGAYFWLNYRGAAPATSGGTNINVMLPQNSVTSPAPTP